MSKKYILIKVTKSPNDTLLAQILNLIQNAASKKLSISRIADKVANIFIPLVIATSVATFCIWASFGMEYYNFFSFLCVVNFNRRNFFGIADKFHF